jgi:hypothetical protein
LPWRLAAAMAAATAAATAAERAAEATAAAVEAECALNVNEEVVDAAKRQVEHPAARRQR